MATLAFEVKADYDKVIRLREEIEKLEAQLKNTSTPIELVPNIEAQIRQNKQELNGMVSAAASAGASIESNLKKKMFDAANAALDLKEKIIEQKAVVQELKGQYDQVAEKYKETAAAKGKNSRAAKELKGELHGLGMALTEERGALFAMTQEQQKATITTQRLREEYKAMAKDSDSGIEMAKVADEIGKKMRQATMAIIGVQSIGGFIKSMVQVRSQFQAADTAIETLLGNKEKADALMKEVRDYAKISPLEFSDVTRATQMMLGFNIEAEKVPKFLAAIGDVSMGNSQKFNSLTLAFSQMSAAGKLMGQDLLKCVA